MADASPRIPWPLLAAILLFLGTSGVVQMEPAPTDLLFLAVCGCAALTGFTLRGLSVPALIGAGVFLVANLISMLATRTGGASIRYFAITVYMFMAWALLAALIQRYGMRLVRHMCHALIVAALIAAAIGILAKYRLIPNPGRFFMDEAGTRVKGPFKDPNVFGPFLGFAAMLLLAGWVERGGQLVLRLAGVCVLAFGVFLSFSRGAYANLAASVGIFAVLVVFVVQDRTSTRRLLMVGLTGAALAIPLVLYLAFGSEYSEFLNKRMTMQDYDNHRFATQGMALESAQLYPLGIGPGSWTSDRFGLATHNVYLRVLAENGWLGLASFLMFCAAAVATTLRGAARGGKGAVLQAALAAVVIANLLESFIIDSLHWRHLFIALGIGSGIGAYQASATDREADGAATSAGGPAMTPPATASAGQAPTELLEVRP